MTPPTVPEVAFDPKRELLERAAALFAARFGSPPAALGFAPGRVEILGNHTDYNGGYILSVALGLGIAAAAGPARHGRLEAWSESLGRAADVALGDESRSQGEPWSDYLKGVVLELRRAGRDPGGLRIALAADLPSGAGVSSSAALELAVALAALGARGLPPLTPMELARLCQRAESSFVGVPCGILDQFSSAFGQPDHLLFLDCATLEHAAVPLSGGTPADSGSAAGIVIADSGVKHALVDGQYARLRGACERATRRLAELSGRPLRFLRDVDLATFERHAAGLDAEERRRAEHVVHENARVLAGRDAAAHGDRRELGRLMLESHASSRDLFGNSCRELDVLVEEAQGIAGFLGGKLSGGGFGGATVNLIETAHLEAFALELAARYARRAGARLRPIVCPIGGGARGWRLSR